jgi:hypothetical protein
MFRYFVNNTNKSLPLRYWLSVASLMLSCICKSHAATLQVPANYPTIQAAVDAAKDGDTIELEAGRRFEEPIVVGNWPTWTKNIKLIGSGTSGNRPVIAGSLKTFNNGGWFFAQNIRFENLVYPWISGDTVFFDCEFLGSVSSASYGLAYINCIFLGDVEIQANYSKTPVLLQNCTFAPSSSVVVQGYVNEGKEEGDGVVAINTVFDGNFNYGRKRCPLTAVNCYINRSRFKGDVLSFNPYIGSVRYRDESAKDYRLSDIGAWIDSGCSDRIFNDPDGSISGIGYGFGGRVGWIPVWVNDITAGTAGVVNRKLYNLSDKTVLIDLSSVPRGVKIQASAGLTADKMMVAPFSSAEVTIELTTPVKSGDRIAQSIFVDPILVRYVASGESIQKAIDSSVSGETIIVDSGVYTEVLKFGNKVVGLISVEPRQAIIAYPGSGSSNYGTMIDMSAIGGSSIDGFVLTGLPGNFDNVMRCKESKVTNCLFIKNYKQDTGGSGGCIQGSATVDKCEFTQNNTAPFKGEFTIRNSIFHDFSKK